jgi:hypothetical protein
MSLLNLLRGIRRHPAKPRRKITTFRPRIEALEDRQLLSISWVAGMPGEWSERMNWQDDMGQNRVPGPKDDVTLPDFPLFPPVTYTVGEPSVCHSLSTPADNPLVITGGLHVEGDATLNGALAVGGGSTVFDRPSTINVSLTLSGTSTLLSFPTGAAATASSVLNGPVTWTGGSLNGGSDAHPLLLGAGNTMTLFGPDLKSFPVGFLDVTPTAQVVHQGGNLNLSGPLNNEGVYDLQTDANIVYVSGGGSFFNSGTGILRKSGGSGTSTVDFFVNTGGRVEGHAGTLRLVLSTNSTYTGGTFDVGEGDLVDLASNGIAGNPPVFTGRYTGTGRGTVRLETGIGVGAAGATFEFPGPVDPPSGNTGQVISHLTGAENGISDITAPINSLVGVFLGPDQPDQSPAPDALDFSTAASRDYAVLAPALKQVFFIGDGLTSTGDPHQVIVPDGATRLYLGTMDGFEWRNNSGAFSVRINHVNGGNFPVLVPGISDPWLAGMPNGSTASIDDVAPDQSPAQVPDLTLTAGDALTFAASGSVNFFPTMFEWTAQGFTGAGTLTNNGFMRIAGPDSKRLVNTLLNNNGTIIHTGGTLVVAGNAAVNNQGTYDLQTTIYPNSSITDHFNNTGTLRKSLSADRASLGGVFNNNGGTVDVQSGRLDLPSGTHTGGIFYTADGTTLGLFSGTVTRTYTGWKAGSGVVSLASGCTVGAGGATWDFEQDGMLRWSTGTIIAGPDGLTNMGSLTLIGPVEHPFGGGVLTNNGRMIHTGSGGLDLPFGTTLVNNGFYDLQGDASIGAQQGGTFQNKGMFIKSQGTGTSFNNHWVNNRDGRIDVESGTLHLLDSFTNDGTVIIAAGMTFQVGGTYTQNGTGTLEVQLGGSPASGLFGKLVVGGTATLAGTLQVDLVNGYGGNPGDVFTILTFGSRMGDFDNLLLPPGAAWDASTGTVSF